MRARNGNGGLRMNSRSVSMNLDPMAEVERLNAIAEYLKQSLSEVLEMLSAAIARAEGMPLLKPLEGQTDFEDDK